jgi:hypothetical protein
VARQLNGVDFPKNARWINRLEWSGVTQSVNKTLGGKVVVYVKPDSGRTIDIECTEYCQYTLDDLTEIMAFYAQVGGSFPFVWDDFNATVMFRHHDAPAIESTPLIKTRDSHDERQYFSVKIKLLIL